MSDQASCPDCDGTDLDDDTIYIKMIKGNVTMVPAHYCNVCKFVFLWEKDIKDQIFTT